MKTKLFILFALIIAISLIFTSCHNHVLPENTVASTAQTRTVAIYFSVTKSGESSIRSVKAIVSVPVDSNLTKAESLGGKDFKIAVVAPAGSSQYVRVRWALTNDAGKIWYYYGTVDYSLNANQEGIEHLNFTYNNDDTVTTPGNLNIYYRAQYTVGNDIFYQYWNEVWNSAAYVPADD